MVTFGLSGGICSGKSRITKLFLANDIPMVDADEVARQLVCIGKPAYYKLLNNFGPSYFTNDGYLNRKKLADLIFFNKSARRLLDSIMGPFIEEEVNKQTEAFHLAGNKIVGFDCALIVEMGLVDKYRPLIVVHCAPEIQIERMMRRNLLTRAEAVARLESQLPREEKIKIADFVIDSSSLVEETAKKAQLVINSIRTQYSS